MRSIATIQGALVLLPPLLLVWSWGLYTAFILIYTTVVAHHITQNALMSAGPAAATYFLVGLPLAYIEWRFIRYCIRRSDMKDLSISLVIFLFLCGMTAAATSKFLSGCPWLI